MEKRQRDLHYKLAEIYKSTQTLQTVLTSALPAGLAVEERKEPWGEMERYIHEPKTDAGILFGQLVVLNVNAERQVVGITPGKANYILKQVASPPVEGAKKSEFTEGRLFFAIRGEHVILLQSSSCRAKAFEEHLQWLFEKRNALDEGQVVHLNDLPPAEIRKHALQGVLSMSLRAPLDAEATQIGGELSFKPKGPMWDSVKSAFKQFSGTPPDGFSLGGDFDPRHIKVKMDIQCASKYLGQAQSLMNTLGNLLRHDESNDVLIVLEDGKRLRGKDLKQSKRYGVEHSKKEPISQSVYAAMREYLQHLIESGNLM